jgi:mannose/fructose/N-acetylgalactosamine-specific phosphotransferase system component IID
MYLVPLAWIYVTLMMAVAEATNDNGTVLGAILTFVLYGLLPVGLVLYFMGTPARKRARIQADAEADAANTASQAASNPPDTRGKAATDAVAPVRKEP